MALILGLVLEQAIFPTLSLLYSWAVGCHGRKHQPWRHSLEEVLGCIQSKTIYALLD